MCKFKDLGKIVFIDNLEEAISQGFYEGSGDFFTINSWDTLDYAHPESLWFLSFDFYISVVSDFLLSVCFQVVI